MKIITISDEMAEQLIISIYSRIGIIETGRPMLTIEDAISQKHPEWIKCLNPEQEDLIRNFYKVVEDLRK